MINYFQINRNLYLYQKMFKQFIEINQESNNCKRKKYIKEIIINFNSQSSSARWKKQNIGRLQHKSSSSNKNLNYLQDVKRKRDNFLASIVAEVSRSNKENIIHKGNKSKLDKKLSQIKDMNIDKNANYCQENRNNDLNKYEKYFKGNNLIKNSIKKDDFLNKVSEYIAFLPRFNRESSQKKKNVHDTYILSFSQENSRNSLAMKQNAIVNSNISNKREKSVTTNTNLDSSHQREIDDFIYNKRELDASILVENLIKKNNIPDFITLRHLTAWASKKGHFAKIQIFIKACEQFYPKLLKEEAFFEHYLTEALFHQGKHKEAFLCLTVLVEKYPYSTEVKETVCSLLKLIDSVSGEVHEQALELCKQFINLESDYEPAVILWRYFFMGDQFHLQKIACRLTEEHPDLFDEYDNILIEVVEEAFHNNRIDQLQSLIQIFIKFQCKKPLSEALSSQLSLFCMVSNLSGAREVLDFARQNQVLIRQHSLSQFVNFLHGNKKAIPLSLLTYVYGFGKPLLKSVKSPKTSSIKYKF